ncbi:M20/M25/M40 family metallo-hydrolase [Thalassotalea sp. ND16A]|uniref:M20/M25/M40 family metallo-hydrolase n=1 Tax=Thalassotalea sp. ND16A TaxID=1535422 RepID=UPI00126A5F9C|nr:M20/M25/M40 family metallo-hydrolase [Thalassotalea sp. ND16A]
MKKVFCLFMLNVVAFVGVAAELASHQDVSNSILLAHFKKLSSAEFSGRKTGSAGHKLASQYIKNSFLTEYISSYSSTQSFHFNSGFTQKQGFNHLYVKKGKKLPNKYIVITAHYDHLGKKAGKIYYGADDNASGASALLALKPWLEKIETKHSIVLLATDAEEFGFKGAKAFLQHSAINKEDIIININLDMISYGKKRKYLLAAGSRKKPELKAHIKHINDNAKVKFKLINKIPANYLSSHRASINLHKASDHYEFYKAGIPYLFVTGENHKNYHQSTDSYANVDLQFYSDAFESIKHLIRTFDEKL